MPLMLYNTKKRKKDFLEPIEHGKIKMYSCGPTVYSSAHIGNMRTFIMADVLKRSLTFFGLEVEHVMNITDVGHLTQNDEGEDKIEMAAKREKKTATQITQSYTREFLEDLKRLNILLPNEMPKATDHIEDQISLIKTLEKKGYTYQTSDGVYFDTSKSKNYGEFGGQALEEKQEGARVNKNPEKRSSSDFALWKFSPKDTKRQMEWDSPWGVGFPGWHIECSLMSTKYLGQPFDIHTGGIDLIPVHHENEIAQSSAAYDKHLANYWLHSEFVLFDQGKMAKSEGNVLTIGDLVKKGYDPLAFRYLVLTAHYRSKLRFSYSALDGAQTALNKIRRRLLKYKKPREPRLRYIDELKRHIANDLDTPKIISMMWKLLNTREGVHEKGATILEIDKVLGLGLDEYLDKPFDVPYEIMNIADLRQSYRRSGNFEKADELRQELEDLGYIVEDKPAGFDLHKKE